MKYGHFLLTLLFFLFFFNTARGQGTHGFAIRTDNLAGTTPVKNITLKPGIPATFEWKTRVTAKDGPWVALVVPDRDLARARELRDDK